jgi:plasmid stabilization system protein ParE
MLQLVWTLRARADIQDHYDYLLGVDEQAVLRAIRAIVEAGRKLVLTPKIGVLLIKNQVYARKQLPLAKSAMCCTTYQQIAK